MTRFEKIKSLTPEDLASFASDHCVDEICDIVCNGDCKAWPTLDKTAEEVCEEIVIRWLNSEVLP